MKGFIFIHIYDTYVKLLNWETFWETQVINHVVYEQYYGGEQQDVGNFFVLQPLLHKYK